MESLNNQEYSENDLQHIVPPECECTECQNKRGYVQIIDVDSYVANLDDWD